jgi:hypothetical protein
MVWIVIFAAIMVLPALSYDRERDRQIAEQNEKRHRAYRKKWEKPHGA